MEVNSGIITKDSYYMGIAEAVAEKSNCLCVSFGCVIVKDDQIISTGYVGAPRKTKSCIDLNFCIRRERNVKSGEGYEMCRSVHAEMNAIVNAGRAGVSFLNGTMYLHTSKKENNRLIPIKSYPCLICKKMIINAGIKKFIGNNQDGSLSIYRVSDWVKHWQSLNDITYDKDKYECKYS